MNVTTIPIGPYPLRTDVTVYSGLKKIKGWGSSTIKALLYYLNISFNKKINDLDSQELNILNQIYYLVRDQNINIVQYLCNVRKSGVQLSTAINQKQSFSNKTKLFFYINDIGSNKHFIGDQLSTKTKLDIHRLKQTKGYRGIRHLSGDKVRHQKTSTTGRTNKKLKVKKK